MKKALILAFLISMFSCSHEIDVQGPDCEPCSCDSNQTVAVPIDCYNWGINPWPGYGEEPDYHAIQGWLQAATIDTLESNSGEVEVDFAVLTEINKITKVEKIVDSLGYGGVTRQLTKNEGGLFSRWYTDSTFLPMLNSKVENGVLKITVGQFTRRVSHWWLNSSGKYARRLDCSYQMKVRMRIKGNIAVQLAADYYRTTASDFPNNKEAFHSAWFTDTGGEFKIFCYPPK